MRHTNIVVAVFYQKGDALGDKRLAPSGVAQAVSGAGDVGEELAIREAAAGEGVDDSDRLGVVGGDGLEDGQARECGGGEHPAREGRGACAMERRHAWASRGGGGDDGDDVCPGGNGGGSSGNGGTGERRREPGGQQQRRC